MYDSATGMTFGQKPDQDRTMAEFFTEPVLLEFKTQQEGRPVYEDVEKVRIISPGQKLTEVIRRVTDEHRQRWPDLYAKFKAGLEQAPDGTPIEEWPPITKAMALNLRGLNIKTVEQLASAPEPAIAAIGMGGRDLVQKAGAWLASVNDAKPLAEALAAKAQLQAEIEVRDNQIASLTEAVKMLQEKINGTT